MHIQLDSSDCSSSPCMVTAKTVDTEASNPQQFTAGTKRPCSWAPAICTEFEGWKAWPNLGGNLNL